MKAPSTTLRTRKPRRQRSEKAWKGLFFIAPAMSLVTVFFVAPVLFTMWMSLHKWPLIGTPTWVGLRNYLRLLSDGRFADALIFTATYSTFVTIGIFVIAFPLALLVERNRRMVSAYRTVIFMPVVVGLGSASLLWVWLSNVDSGLFSPLLERLGLTDGSVNILAGYDSAFWSIIAMVIWKTVGFTMVILLTGLQAIPADLTEAARIDGARFWQRFRYLTLPLMRKTFALALILSLTGSILAFDQFYIITSGGPENRMITAVYYIINQSFVSFKMGYGAALSVVLLTILVAISVFQLWLLRVGKDD